MTAFVDIRVLTARFFRNPGPDPKPDVLGKTAERPLTWQKFKKSLSKGCGCFFVNLDIICALMIGLGICIGLIVLLALAIKANQSTLTPGPSPGLTPGPTENEHQPAYDEYATERAELQKMKLFHKGKLMPVVKLVLCNLNVKKVINLKHFWTFFIYSSRAFQ